MQVLHSDYGQVQKLVEEAVRQLSAAASTSAVTPLDKCQLMEQMNDNHVSQLLPRLRACDKQVAAFTQRCLNDKVWLRSLFWIPVLFTFAGFSCDAVRLGLANTLARQAGHSIRCTTLS